MKRPLKGLLITLLFTILLNLVLFTPAVSAAEKLPIVWVKVHRIQTIDDSGSVLESNTRWKYNITVSDGKTLTTQDYTCDKTGDDIIINNLDSFNVENQDVFIKIAVYKCNQLEYETADISSSGTSFNCTYNLASNELAGDKTSTNGGDYYTTSGDHDKNVANLWFAIFDNYDAPVANAGGDQFVYTREKANFDGSLSTASEGSSIVNFEWDFENDGVIDAEGENTSYTYKLKGTQTCRLVVTDSIGVMSEDTCLVNVLNRYPKVEFTFSPSNPSIQDMVNITDVSSDHDGSIISRFWDFGDGTNSTLLNPSHTYSQKGVANNPNSYR